MNQHFSYMDEIKGALDTIKELKQLTVSSSETQTALNEVETSLSVDIKDKNSDECSTGIKKLKSLLENVNKAES